MAASARIVGVASKRAHLEKKGWGRGDHWVGGRHRNELAKKGGGGSRE